MGNSKSRESEELLSAVSRGNLSEVRLLIECGLSANAAIANGTSALHLAAGMGFQDILEFLLANGANVNARDKNGNTPLDMARTCQQTASVEVLLASGGGS